MYIKPNLLIYPISLPPPDFPFGNHKFIFNTCKSAFVSEMSSCIVKSLNCVRLFVTPWTVVSQASLSMGFSKRGYWSGVPLPSPGDLSNPGIEPGSSALQAEALPSEPPRKPIGINLCFLFSSYVYHRRIYLNNFFQKKKD